ncbi:MAG: phosphate ABC transporter permease subunit PstC [Oligoflexia bacterium]|nr:phosphate ABC transporter permease subunit PstC [Oligoflexia bacterium]
MENVVNHSSNTKPTPSSSPSGGPKGGFFSLKNQDKLHLTAIKSLAVFVIGLLITLLILLLKQAWPAVTEFGVEFITSDWWNPVEDQFGGLSFIVGTVLTSIIAIIIAAPVSIGVALLMTEVLPERAGKTIGLFVEMIAAIPSIVFGLWGLFYLAPFVRETLTPIIKSTLGFIPFFNGPSFGIGVLTASLILAIMIIPTITSLCREVFRSVPTLQREAALGLGSTRWEMIRLAVIKPSFSGIMGGIVLGLGRALGETMAVAMVIGNQPEIPKSIFSSAATMASVIANEYAEADSDLHVSALCLVGILLFGVTLIANAIARLIVWNYNRKQQG